MGLKTVAGIDDRARLMTNLGWARRRASSAMPASPEWEAAIAAVDAFELELDSLDAKSTGGSGAPQPAGSSTALQFAPVILPDGMTLQGTIAGTTDRAWVMRGKVRDLADRAVTGRGLLRELERLATRIGFVVEISTMEQASVTFYAWEDAPPPSA